MVNDSISGWSRYRWYILALATLTNSMVAAAPMMSMSVLFKSISLDLHLDLVQVGLVWGISSLPAIFSTLVGGAVGDRFGPKRVLIAGCLLVGLTGALRGLAFDFISLTVIMLVFGLFSPFITMNTFKNCSAWFPSQQMGLASGVLSMGMALGFLIGSMFSATLLEPWLGGWRQVFYFYGVTGLLLSIPWMFTRLAPSFVANRSSAARPVSIRQNLAYVVRIRNVWLQGLAILGIGGCITGMLGYLPLYLRGQGWPDALADGALASFHTASLIFAVPIAILSDRLRTRKKILIGAGVMIALGIGLLTVARGGFVWPAVCIAGMVRDGFMAVFTTSILETEGIGPVYVGTAMGMVMVFSGIGGLVAPPLGNSLASLSPSLPFLFWSALTLVGFVGLGLARERAASPVPA